MAGKEELPLSLPDPPPPAPARREAAIEAALRRFDGGGEASLAPKAAQPGRRPLRTRPYLGSVLAVSLLALVVAPLMWLRDERQRPAPQEALNLPSATPQGSEIAKRQPTQSDLPLAVEHDEPAALDTAEPEATPPMPRALAEAESQPLPMPAAPSPPPPMAAEAARAARSEERAVPAPPAVSMSLAAPVTPAAPPAAKAAASREQYAGDRGDIIVTSARRDPSRLEGRGDWNACTVNDPRQDISACRRVVNPSPKGKTGTAAVHLADGLAHAWRGDMDAAIADFDRAIAIAPNSSFAYLNRGLAHQSQGDQDRALADFDKAVKYAPHAARPYYNRSLLLRERGDLRRAEADRRRAIDLDSRYEGRR